MEKLGGRSVPINGMGVAVAGAQILGGYPHTVFPRWAEHPEPVQGKTQKFAVASGHGAGVFDANTQVVVMVLAKAFRVAAACVLNFVGWGVASQAVQGVENCHPRQSKTDNAHGQASRRGSNIWHRGQIQHDRLDGNTVWIAVVLKGVVLGTNGVNPSGVTRQVIGADQT